MRYSPSDFERIISDILLRIWKQNDMDAIDALFDPDCAVHGLLSGVSLNRAEYREVVEQFQQLSRLDRFELLEILHDGGDRAAVRIRMSITAFAAGVTAPQDATMFISLKEGKASEMHVQFDTLQYFELIGALPENSTFLLMTGHALH